MPLMTNTYERRISAMVIQEITTTSGATVRIHNDYCVPKGSEQEKRAIEQQRRMAHEILIAAAERQHNSSE